MTPPCAPGVDVNKATEVHPAAARSLSPLTRSKGRVCLSRGCELRPSLSLQRCCSRLLCFGGGHSSPRANPQQAKTPAWPSRSSSLSSGDVAWAGRPSPALAAAARLGNKKPPLVQPPKLGQLCPERSQKKICGMRFANAGEFERFSAGDPQGCAIPVQGFEGRWQRLPRVLPELETIEQRSFVHKNIIYKKKKNSPCIVFNE